MFQFWSDKFSTEAITFPILYLRFSFLYVFVFSYPSCLICLNSQLHGSLSTLKWPINQSNPYIKDFSINSIAGLKQKAWSFVHFCRALTVLPHQLPKSFSSWSLHLLLFLFHPRPPWRASRSEVWGWGMKAWFVLCLWRRFTAMEI